MKEILEKHIELQKNYAQLDHYKGKFDPTKIDGYPVGTAYDYVKDMQFHLNQEIDELMIAIAKGSRDIHKPWSVKNGQIRALEYISTSHIREEAVDALCFMMNIMIASGVTPDNIETLYEEVYQKNRARQDDEKY